MTQKAGTWKRLQHIPHPIDARTTSITNSQFRNIHHKALKIKKNQAAGKLKTQVKSNQTSEIQDKRGAQTKITPEKFIQELTPIHSQSLYKQ